MANTVYVGADIAQAKFDAAVWQGSAGKALKSFSNNAAGFEQFAQSVRAAVPGHDTASVLVLEPTGGYEMALVAFAYERGWRVCLPNPKQVRDFAKTSGRRAKTDAQDALLLAQFGAEQQPEPQAELPVPIQELIELLHRREDLQQLKRSESNRLLGLQQRPRPAKAVSESLERTIAALDAELVAIEQAIAELLTQNPKLKREAKRLHSVPGIGKRNVLPILVLFYRWRARTNGQGTPKGLVAFVGLDPQPYESGRSVHKRATISKMGDRSVRRYLYLGALGGVRGQNVLRTFYRRLVSRGKAKRLALVAAAHKILIWAWAVFSNDVDFDPARFPQESPAAI
jgi:transposase